MRYETVFSILPLISFLMIGLIVSGCGSSTDGDFPLPPPTPETYSLEVTVSPSQGGSADPSSGIYQEEESVTVEATPNEGWIFDRWDGDLESEENPFTFTITQNTSLTANFVDTQSIYEVRLVLSTSDANIELEFGQVDGATNAYDEGVDYEAPPDPPEGVLNAWFEINDLRLFHDYRSATAAQLTWELNYRTGNGEALELNWEIDLTQAEGSLILKDEAQTFEIDMFEESVYEVGESTSGKLIISYFKD